MQHSTREAVELLKLLRPRYVLPMANGDIDAVGSVAALVRPLGSAAEFERGLVASGLETELLNRLLRLGHSSC